MIPAFTAIAQSSPVIGIICVTLLAFMVLVKAWTPWRQVELAADNSLRGDLLGRIGTLEGEIIAIRKAMDTERNRHESEMRALTEKHTSEMRELTDRQSSEMRIVRHQLNNETMSLDMLLAMLETAPNKVTESIGKIKEMRAQRRLEIAAETGSLHQAKESK